MVSLQGRVEWGMGSACLQDVGLAERALGHAQKAPADRRCSLRYLHEAADTLCIVLVDGFQVGFSSIHLHQGPVTPRQAGRASSCPSLRQFHSWRLAC